MAAYRSRPRNRETWLRATEAPRSRMDMQEALGLMHASCHAQIHHMGGLDRRIQRVGTISRKFVTWHGSFVSFCDRLEREVGAAG
ncbi:hypothetical protein GCM10010872_23210 [Dyella flava]|nr:hypothetical protein GCM10010872_23210 [Dyella flava]